MKKNSKDESALPVVPDTQAQNAGQDGSSIERFVTAFYNVYSRRFGEDFDETYEDQAEAADARAYAAKQPTGEYVSSYKFFAKLYPKSMKHADDSIRDELLDETFDVLYEKTKDLSQEALERVIDEYITEPLPELLEAAVCENIDEEETCDFFDDDEVDELLTAATDGYEYCPHEKVRECEKLKIREQWNIDALVSRLEETGKPVDPPRIMYRRSLKQAVASRLFEQSTEEPILITMQTVREKATTDRCKSADVIFSISTEPGGSRGIYKGSELLEKMAVSGDGAEISVQKIVVDMETPEERALWNELFSAFPDAENSSAELAPEPISKSAKMDVTAFNDLREKTKELAWTKYKRTSKPERFNECLEDLGEFVDEWQSQVFDLMDRAMKFNAGIRKSGLMPEMFQQIDMLVTEFMEKLLVGEAVVSEMAKLIPRMGPEGLYFPEEKCTESDG